MKKETGSTSPKRKKRVLGRGLEALIPAVDPLEENPAAYFQCDTDLIHPNRYQPRLHFSQDELKDLSRSIEKQGVIQPLLVRKDETGYELVAGERRLRAAKMAGLSRVPVVVKDITDVDLLSISLIENIQRENLNPLEEAEAYHRLITEFKLTQEEAAARVGKSRSAVTNILRLRQLPAQIKTSITDGSLSMGHARAILGAETAAQQIAAWRTVIAKDLSVRDTERLIKRLKDTPAKPQDPELPETSEARYLVDVADELSLQFGTRVKINRRGKKGKVEIDFFNDDDLDRLLGLLRQVDADVEA